MTHAVITGDFIHSTKMKAMHRSWLFGHVADALKVWNKDFEIKKE